jgi:hypothetical protein
MPAAKRKQTPQPARREVRVGHTKLELVDQPHTEAQPDAIPEMFVRAGIVGSCLEVQLIVGIEDRQTSIARGVPVPALFVVPDFGNQDPGATDERINVTDDTALAVVNAMRRCIEEAQRSGIFPEA